MTRYHKTDAWRGYEIPDLAVAGSSYTGEWSDSPCPAKDVRPELMRMRTFLSQNGIKTKITSSDSSNAFMSKLWIEVVNKKDFEKAGKLATAWLTKHANDTRFIHDADLLKGTKKLRRLS
ncbi:hypothetical protein KY333_05860 [Candidatus Woesearchaeota archaeon]|nr:hypothetical protein [Candidatus Woesearchaeota archaeon]